MAEPVLYARMELRIRDVERQLAKVQKTTDTSMAGLERRTRKAGANIESSLAGSFSKISSLAKASIAGLFAGVAAGGIGGLAAGFASAAKSVAELGDEAKRAGVSVEAFQELRFVGEQARVGIDSITDGLKELSLRADEFVTTGAGSGAEAFSRLGYTAQDLKEKLKEPNELFIEIIGRLGELDKAAQIRIADEVFGGTGGEKFVQLIDQGEAGIRNQIKAARDLGVVIDADLVKRAAELDAKFNTIVTTVGSNLKSAIVSASDSLVDFIDRWRAVENRQTSTLNTQQIEVDKQRLDLETRILETQNNQALSAQNRAKAVGQLKIQMDGLTQKSGEIAVALNGRLPAVDKVTDRTFTPIAPVDSKAESARAKAAKEADRERQAVTDLIAQLDFEFSLIGKTAAQQEKMNALRQAGSAATAEEQLAITSKIDAIQNETDATDRLADAARDFAGTLVDGFLNGASAAETLGNALKNLGSRFIDSGLDQLFGGSSGGGTGLIGGLHIVGVTA